MIRGIIHQEGVNRIGTSSQGSSFVRIVLIQVRFLVVGRREDFTHQLRDFYSRCILGLFPSLIWNAAFEIAKYLQFCIPHICKLTCGLTTYVCARVVFITLRDEEESRGRALSHGDHFQRLPKLHLDRATEAYFVSCVKISVTPF